MISIWEIESHTAKKNNVNAQYIRMINITIWLPEKEKEFIVFFSVINASLYAFCCRLSTLLYLERMAASLTSFFILLLCRVLLALTRDRDFILISQVPEVARVVQDFATVYRWWIMTTCDFMCLEQKRIWIHCTCVKPIKVISKMTELLLNVITFLQFRSWLISM